MKLYYAPGACSIGIHVLLEEIGKPYEAQLVNLREGGQFKPDFTSVNPKSKVPTLVRDDAAVFGDAAAAVVAGGTHRRNACYELDLAQRGHLAWTLLAIHCSAFKKDGRDDVMPAADVGQ